MSDLFDSARLKLSGAKEELEELKAGISAYLNSKPYELSIEFDPNGTQELHKIKLMRRPPSKLGLLCARVAAELRDALDQAGYASAIAGGHIKPTKAYFPICKEAANFENCIRQNCKHIPAGIVTLFRAFKAHPGGDELLVALNNLAGGGKHCVIQPVAHATGGAFYKNLSMTNMVGGFQMHAPRWDTGKDEVILFSVGIGSHIQYEISASLFIAFGEIDFIGGQPVDAVLDALASKVEGIVAATEAECRKLGLIT